MKLIALIATSIACAALGLSFAAFVIADRAESNTTDQAASGTVFPVETPEGQTLEVELGDIYISPQALTASAASEIILAVTNTGGIGHDLTLENGPTTGSLTPGASATLSLGALEAGTYTVFCSVPGHREGGMQATIEVGDRDAHSEGSGRQPHNDEAYLASLAAFPAETSGTGNLPMEPVMDGDVKVFDLVASEFQWEIEPGVFRDAMGYNGQVPGPQIHVQLGDRIRMVLHNELSESTSLHFHGLIVPNDQDGVPGLTQPMVMPGDTYVYEFTVRNSGSHMYHAHMNSATQVPMGLLGALIVDGEDEPEVDQDVTLILNDGPLGYTINGKGFPATSPIVAKEGERIRVRYMNEGLQIHPMHLHGIPQLVIALDGNPVPAPYLQDTVMIAPGQRVDVLVDATELGAWAFHCHILSHAEGADGMFGMVTALIVQEQ